jgi:hypothetical protein
MKAMLPWQSRPYRLLTRAGAHTRPRTPSVPGMAGGILALSSWGGEDRGLCVEGHRRVLNDKVFKASGRRPE